MSRITIDGIGFNLLAIITNEFALYLTYSVIFILVNYWLTERQLTLSEHLQNQIEKS
jgi:hypothetical protein